MLSPNLSLEFVFFEPGPDFDQVEFGVEIRNYDIKVILTRLFILGRMESKLFSFDNFGLSYDQIYNSGLDLRIQIRHHNSA
uniref:Uncharacterized protein n=1 Tax=Meloidogyne enterolobii TaxID=390850 RepID=A0A6V7W4Z3_MELEN|nr:unnamed protein product [Meloidogyne enterolobii]